MSFGDAAHVVDAERPFLSEAFSDAVHTDDSFNKESGYLLSLPKILLSTDGKIYLNIGTKTFLVTQDKTIKTQDVFLQGI